MARNTLVFLSLVSVVVLALAGCEQKPAPTQAAKPAQQPVAGSQPSASELASLRQFVQNPDNAGQQNLPPGHPPISNTPTTLPGSLMPEEAAASPLKFKTPEGWVTEKPSSSMRFAQYGFPHAAGDTEDGELAVFGPNIGGSVDANIARWRGQFTTADGQPVPDSDVKKETFDVGKLKVTYIDVGGRFSAGMMGPAAGASPATKDGWRLLGAIVETPGGPWYFKALGPDATMAQQRDAFMNMLKSVSFE